MSTFHPTPDQVIGWWKHRLADLGANLAGVQAEVANDQGGALSWRETLADRAMRLHNDIAEVERVLLEWQKLAHD